MADEQLRQAQIQKQAKPVKQTVAKAPIKVEKKDEKVENKKTETKDTEKKIEKKVEKKIVKPLVKKDEAVVFSRSVPISTKYAKAIGMFIKNKPINESIRNLEQVKLKKLAIPMKGELAHRKGKKLNGKGMTGGKYPVKASEYFIKLLKTLNANCNVNGLDLDKTKISEVIVNKGPQQLHRFGRTAFKRTHVMIKARELEKINNLSKKNQIKEMEGKK